MKKYIALFLCLFIPQIGSAEDKKSGEQVLQIIAAKYKCTQPQGINGRYAFQVDFENSNIYLLDTCSGEIIKIKDNSSFNEFMEIMGVNKESTK